MKTFGFTKRKQRGGTTKRSAHVPLRLAKKFYFLTQDSSCSLGSLSQDGRGPFIIKEFLPFEVVEISGLESTRSFKVNGQCLKHYLEGEVEWEMTSLDLTTLLS